MEESEYRRLIRAWLRHSNSLRILLSGKTGSGKSSLVNTLLGKEVAREGGGILSETRKVGSHTELKDSLGPLPELQVTVNNVHVTIWDTPGLKDPSTDQESTLTEIKNKCLNQVDLLVYCIQITQTRAGQDEYDAIIDLTKALGVDIWKNAVFALTFANEIQSPTSSETGPEEYYTSRVHSWKQVIHEALVKAGLSQADAEEIPVVPTGYRKESILYQPNWFSDFWKSCLMQMRFSSVTAIAAVSNDRERIEITAVVIAERLKQIGDNLNRQLGLSDESVDLASLVRFAPQAHNIMFRLLSVEIQQYVSLPTVPTSDDADTPDGTSTSFSTPGVFSFPTSWRLVLFVGGVVFIAYAFGQYLYKKK